MMYRHRINSKLDRHGERGAIAIMFAFVIVLMVALTAMIIDLGHAMTVRSQVGTAVEAAAIAGGAHDQLEPYAANASIRDTIMRYYRVNSPMHESASSNIPALQITLNHDDIRLRSVGNPVRTFFAGVFDRSFDQIEVSSAARVVKSQRGVLQDPAQIVYSLPWNGSVENASPYASYFHGVPTGTGFYTNRRYYYEAKEPWHDTRRCNSSGAHTPYRCTLLENIWMLAIDLNKAKATNVQIGLTHYNQTWSSGDPHNGAAASAFHHKSDDFYAHWQDEPVSNPGQDWKYIVGMGNNQTDPWQVKNLDRLFREGNTGNHDTISPSSGLFDAYQILLDGNQSRTGIKRVVLVSGGSGELDEKLGYMSGITDYNSREREAGRYGGDTPDTIGGDIYLMNNIECVAATKGDPRWSTLNANQRYWRRNYPDKTWAWVDPFPAGYEYTNPPDPLVTSRCDPYWQDDKDRLKMVKGRAQLARMCDHLRSQGVEIYVIAPDRNFHQPISTGPTKIKPELAKLVDWQNREDFKALAYCASSFQNPSGLPGIRAAFAATIEDVKRLRIAE